MKRSITSESPDAQPFATDGDEPRTLTERVYRRIRSDILWGVLAPDAPLRSDELRSTYDIGVSPLREALTRLAAERLVTSVGQRGFRVAPISAGDVTDVMETRLIIESVALRKSIEQGDIAWETRVVAAYHAISRTPIPRSPEDEVSSKWATHHRAFHMELLSACGSRWQMNLASLLFDQAERFRLVRATKAGASLQSRDPSDEHRDIIEAVLARDADRAVKALDNHYRETTKQVLSYITVQDCHDG